MMTDHKPTLVELIEAYEATCRAWTESSTELDDDDESDEAEAIRRASVALNCRLLRLGGAETITADPRAWVFHVHHRGTLYGANPHDYWPCVYRGFKSAADVDAEEKERR